MELGNEVYDPRTTAWAKPLPGRKNAGGKNSKVYTPEDDFWKVYALAEGQDRVMLLAILHLAARRSEIFKIKTSDLDFENKRVRLWTRKRKGGNLEADWLPMTSELKDALSWWLQSRPVKDSPYVFLCLDKFNFCSEQYGQPFKYRQKLMHRLCEKAKVKRFGFHAIRHFTASQLYKKGYNVAVIQTILRHKSPSTTERYLKSLGLESVRGALEDLSLPKGKILKFEPRVIKGTKNEIEMKKPSKEPSTPFTAEKQVTAG